MTEKIQKVLAQAGLGSRREIEKWVAAGRVKINGRPAQVGDRVSPDDKVSLDGRPIKLARRDARTRVLAYNKPVGQICTRNDPEGRKTVFEALPPVKGGPWVAIGRLDINTNDGELANRLMHPSNEIEREYVVRVHGAVDESMINRMLQGVELDDGLASFNRIKAGAKSGTHQWFSVVLTEGRQREVRRLWESQGVEVSRLKRVRYGSVALPSYVRVTEYMDLSPVDIAKLGKLVDMKFKPTALTPQEQEQRKRQIRRLRARGAT